MSRKLTLGQKRARTRTARVNFVNTFGEDTVEVVRELINGSTTQEVSDVLGINRGTVAAIAANLTRGTYDDVLVNCNF